MPPIYPKILSSTYETSKKNGGTGVGLQKTNPLETEEKLKKLKYTHTRKTPLIHIMKFY